MILASYGDRVGQKRPLKGFRTNRW
jgi:hypothetical protein